MREEGAVPDEPDRPGDPDAVPGSAGAAAPADPAGPVADDPDRRAAQDSVAELVRMGIDPLAIGLDPGPEVHRPSVRRVRGVAPVPHAHGEDHRGYPVAGTGGHRFGATVVRYEVPREPDPLSAAEEVLRRAPLPPVQISLTRAPIPAQRTASPAHAAPPDEPAPAPDAGEPDAVATETVAPLDALDALETLDAFGPPAVAPPEPAAGSPLNRPLGDSVAPVPAAPPPEADELAEPLGRVADTYRVVLPAPWRRALRAMTFGMFAPGAADAVQRERMLVARVRARRREPWVVGFVAGKGGVGTTTAAAGVALTLATLRTDPVALVDARHGTTSLGRRLAGHDAPTIAQLSERSPDTAPAVPLRVRGLGVVDGAPWHGQTPRNQLVSAIEELRQENAFTLVDVGNDLSEPGHAALGRVDQVVLVTTTSQDAIDAARIALGRIRQIEPLRLTTIVIAVVCLTARQYRRAARRLQAELAAPGRRVVAVPFDPSLATGGPLQPALLRPATREAFVRLAGFVADAGHADDSLLSLRSAIDDETAFLPLADRRART